MAQLYRIRNGISSGFWSRNSDEDINRSLKANGVTVIFDKFGNRKVFLHPEVNQQYSRAIIKHDDVCVPASMKELEDALASAGKIYGYMEYAHLKHQ